MIRYHFHWHFSVPAGQRIYPFPACTSQSKPTAGRFSDSNVYLLLSVYLRTTPATPLASDHLPTWPLHISVLPSARLAPILPTALAASKTRLAFIDSALPSSLSLPKPPFSLVPPSRATTIKWAVEMGGGLPPPYSQRGFSFGGLPVGAPAADPRPRPSLRRGPPRGLLPSYCLLKLVPN